VVLARRQNILSLTTTVEQHGMSPRLERALSKALEEELSRELAPILEPIMSRIKGLIPAIINNCRLELMRTSPSSDDEQVFTPSTESFGEGSSDGGFGNLGTQSKDRSVRTPPSCPGSTSQLVPIPELAPNKTQYRLFDNSGPSSSVHAVTICSQEKGFSQHGNIVMDMFYPGSNNDTTYAQVEEMDNFFDFGGENTSFSLPVDISIDASLPALEGTSANTMPTYFDPSHGFVP
jgi:hypothetical protein